MNKIKFKNGVCFNTDCMKLMKEMKDNSVNLTLTDIPYDGVNRKSNVFNFPCGRGKLHPTEKNHDLIKDLILDNSNEGEILFDPCAGGGTHLYLGSLLNRKVIGSELSEEYFEIIKDRFKGEN